MIVDDIVRGAEVHPDKPALDYNAQVWSYRELASRIAVARRCLHDLGLGGEGVVALAVHNIRDFWVTSLALRSLGATTIVLQSTEALAALELPQLRAVVASGVENWPLLEGACAARGVPLAQVAAYDAQPLALDAARPWREGGHIMQTSGTTGVFKQVLFEPSFESGYMQQRRRANGVTADTVLNVFDFAPWTGVGYKGPVSAWMVGASVVVNQHRHAGEALNRPGVSHSVVVPTMLRTLLAAPEGAYPRRPGMQISITGGTITQAEINATHERITDVLTNGLGATESLCIAYTRMDTTDDHRWQTPVPETQVEVVNDEGRPVGVGEIGRLRVTTRDAPQGYLNDEAATRAFFRDGFFYPGDLAVMRDDGRIALMGRVTDVINVGGHKLSPQPVEDRLREALGVTGVCLATMQDEHGEEALHAVLEATAPLDVAALAAAFRAELPQFAGIQVHYAPALPRNEMGKILRPAVAERLAALQR